ncbi:cell division protein FtsL [Nitrospira sp. Kam-Ns4a]
MRTFGTVIAVSLVLALGYVWERVDLVRVGYQVEQLKAQRITLLRERDELRLKVSALTSPERIARVASEKLAMVPPSQGQVVVVRLERAAPSGRGAPQPEIRLAKHEGLQPARRVE